MSVRSAAVVAWTAALFAMPLMVYAATAAVTIQNFAYSPTPLSIRAGDTVTWTNRDSAQHSAFFNDGFKTAALSQGQSASLVFGTAGTFNYICGIHGAAMKGTVTVLAAPTPAPTAPPPTAPPPPPSTPVPAVATPAPTAPPTPEPTPVPSTPAPTSAPITSPTPAGTTAASPSRVAVGVTPAPAPNEGPSAPLIAGAAVALLALAAVVWLIARRT